MMVKDDELQVSELLDPLAQVTLPGEDPIRAEEHRNRIVSHLRPLVRSARARRSRRILRVAAGTTALAAAAALTLWMMPQSTGVERSAVLAQAPTPLTLSVDGTEAKVAHASGIAHIRAGERSELEGVKRVSTEANSTARIEVASHSPQAGLKIVAGPGSEVVIERVSEESGLELLQLSRGHVDVKVPKLKKGSSFIIVTPHFRAYVVGTAFSLNVNPESRQQSCLRVSEGLVRVETVEEPHAELAMVGAGQDWGCEEERGEKAEQPPAPSQSVRAHRAVQAAPAATLERVSGTLAEETALLARAVRSNQQGNFAAAEQDAMKLLKDYPQSPLAADARSLLKQSREAQAE